jgi:eukaryotic-like serine/threonine-protein kinase
MKALLPKLSLACLVAVAGCRGEERDPPTGSTNLAFWSSYRGNAQNTGSLLSASTDVVVANPDGQIAWKHDATMGGSQPITGPDGTVYAASYDGTLFALDPATGTQKWAFSTTGGGYQAYGPSPVLDPDGTLYFGSMGGELYALDSATGQKRWEAPFSAYLYSSAVLGPDKVLYLGDFNGAFFAVNGSTGQQIWKVQMPDAVGEAPALSLDGETVYFGTLDGSFHALDTANGQTRWSRTFVGRIFNSPTVGPDGTVYFGIEQSDFSPGVPNTSDGTLYALDGATGDVKWQFAAGAPVYQSFALASDGTLYFPVNNGKFYALDSSTGAKKWERLPTTTNATSPPAAVGPDGTVYYSNDGSVLAVDGSTGSQKWSWRFPDFGSTPGGDGGGNSAPTLGGDGKLYIWGVNTLYAVP